MLAHIIRLKVTREENAAFAYYFVPGFKTKLPIFDPAVKILKPHVRHTCCTQDTRSDPNILQMYFNKIKVIQIEPEVIFAKPKVTFSNRK